jgi:hypothetical protein
MVLPFHLDDIIDLAKALLVVLVGFLLEDSIFVVIFSYPPINEIFG